MKDDIFVTITSMVAVCNLEDTSSLQLECALLSKGRIYVLCSNVVQAIDDAYGKFLDRTNRSEPFFLSLKIDPVHYWVEDLSLLAQRGSDICEIVKLSKSRLIFADCCDPQTRIEIGELIRQRYKPSISWSPSR